MKMRRICDNCGERLKDKIIGNVCPKCDKVFEVNEYG